MPIREIKGGFTFGGGVFKDKATATRSYRAYLAKKHDKQAKTKKKASAVSRDTKGK